VIAPTDATVHLEPRTRIGAYALCQDEAGRVLLCRIREDTPDDGRWTLPGGGLDWGEHPEQGVLRELDEEAGLSGVVGAVAGVYSRAYDATQTISGRAVHVVGIVYRVTGVAGELRDELEGTTDMCAWFSVDEARRLPLVPLAEFGLALAAEGPR
jgi:8-oxo-dGTP diphosphatase